MTKYEFKFGSVKTAQNILIEAVVVGVGLILFHEVVKLIVRLVKLDKLNSVILGYIQLFLAGVLFHLVFEYTNVNAWYVDNYYTPPE
jgi:hypothetical protein